MLQFESAQTHPICLSCQSKYIHWTFSYWHPTFLNKTPIEWYSKKQATVETATYGSEFIAARTCVDQIVDLQSYLRYLGVLVHGFSYMIGDNKTVIDGASFPHSKLHKQHNAMSIRYVEVFLY
jgi:hypothetical protein